MAEPHVAEMGRADARSERAADDGGEPATARGARRGGAWRANPASEVA
jgi:hypothetical protein